MTQKNYSPKEVQKLLQNKKIVLVDVREPDEHKVERIEGAVLCPLSTFDPKKLLDAGSKAIVFHCAGGKRSATAISKCLEAGLPHNAHVEGGINAWKASGLPTVTS